MNMDIRRIIAEILTQYDCVIIPAFGGFIGNYSPAWIDPVSHAFYPPGKKLLFNINLKQNDGLLATAVTESLSVSYSEACRLIEAFTEECRIALKSGQPVIIPQVGQLTAGPQGIIYFEQDRKANLNPDSFGLSPFISPPIVKRSGIRSQSPEHTLRQKPSPARKYFLPRVIRWAAVLAFPLGVAALLGVTQYDKISADLANNAAILGSVFHRYSAASLVEKKEAPVGVPPLRIQTIVQALPDTTAILIPAIDRFAVIVGAFRIQENAEKLVAKLQQKGFDASVFDQSKTGLYRVTIGTSSDRTTALEMLATAKSTDFSGAWILAK
jgi:hypothetical protein